MNEVFMTHIFFFAFSLYNDAKVNFCVGSMYLLHILQLEKTQQQEKLCRMMHVKTHFTQCCVYPGVLLIEQQLL